MGVFGVFGARPMNPNWARNIRDQCEAAGTAFHFKQWGEWVPYRDVGGVGWTSRQEFCRDGRKKGPWKGAIYGSTTDDRYLFDGKAFESESFNRTIVIKLGKKRAGRKLDGRLHDGFPA